MNRRPPSRGRIQNLWWIVGGFSVLILGAIGWSIWAPERVSGENRLLVATLIGQPAPIMRLPDADGRFQAVPRRGRPTLLIFHMGFF